MADDKKKKKSSWQTEHKCQNCKEKVSSLICTYCKKLSIKVE